MIIEIYLLILNDMLTQHHSSKSLFSRFQSFHKAPNPLSQVIGSLIYYCQFV